MLYSKLVSKIGKVMMIQVRRKISRLVLDEYEIHVKLYLKLSHTNIFVYLEIVNKNYT